MLMSMTEDCLGSREIAADRYVQSLFLFSELAIFVGIYFLAQGLSTSVMVALAVWAIISVSYHPLRKSYLNRQARLYELTSQTSIPTMFHDEERPRNVWIEQLALAEQIGAPDSPKLIPDDFEQRAEVLGLCAVVLGEDG